MDSDHDQPGGIPQQPSPTSCGAPIQGSGWSGHGLQLSPEQVDAVRRVAEIATAHEPALTGLLTRVVDAVPGATLAGLDHRIKQFDSLARKAATLLDRRMSLADACEHLNDPVRFTVVAPRQRYTAVTRSVIATLEDRRLTLEGHWNNWGRPGYQGLNTTWLTSARIRFEIQFHTPESYRAARETHAWYERRRLPGNLPEARLRLQQRIEEAYAQVPTPPGASGMLPGRSGRVRARAVSRTGPVPDAVARTTRRSRTAPGLGRD